MSLVMVDRHSLAYTSLTSRDERGDELIRFS